ncbi:hypothetical protein TorRG33x02_009670 [Trema orientale]|uniref:Uncharacterized protein n=1 Tax=Trema orientale TaxID=63057 RepID=A0A2P5FYN5_TREOI|nr:hypothetical protein TorRG33x02_009670 [Trema orientale]
MSENRNKLCILFTTEDENRGLSTNVDVDLTASTETNDISEKIIEKEVTINDKKEGKRKCKRELYKQKRQEMNEEQKEQFNKRRREYYARKRSCLLEEREEVSIQDGLLFKKRTKLGVNNDQRVLKNDVNLINVQSYECWN